MVRCDRMRSIVVVCAAFIAGCVATGDGAAVSYGGAAAASSDEASSVWIGGAPATQAVSVSAISAGGSQVASSAEASSSYASSSATGPAQPTNVCLAESIESDAEFYCGSADKTLFWCSGDAPPYPDCGPSAVAALGQGYYCCPEPCAPYLNYGAGCSAGKTWFTCPYDYADTSGNCEQVYANSYLFCCTGQ